MVPKINKLQKIKLISYIKGQKKSKWFFQIDIFSKNRTNEFYFTTMKPQVDLFSFWNMSRILRKFTINFISLEKWVDKNGRIQKVKKYNLQVILVQVDEFNFHWLLLHTTVDKKGHHWIDHKSVSLVYVNCQIKLSVWSSNGAWLGQMPIFPNTIGP